MRQRLRDVLRRYGIELPYTRVICPEYAKTIQIDADWRAEITVRRTLVFLDTPEPGDLYDYIPVDPKSDPESRIYPSPDAIETGSRTSGRGTVVYWKPREPLVPYALYVHQYSWTSPGAMSQAALFTELRCDVRTGRLAVEMAAPVMFETAVAFKRPTWPLMNTERSFVKYALSQIGSQGNRPVINPDGQRVEWKLAAPRTGSRYVCVVFGPNGVALWQQRLKETSIAGRAQRLIKSLVPIWN